MNHHYLRFFLFSCFFIFWVGCRQDPKTDNGTTTAVDPYTATVTSRSRAEPTSLNPIMTYQAIDLQLINKMYLPLIEFDPTDLELKPFLAKSMATATTIKEGDELKGIQYTYEIRDDAIWSDGQPVTAADFVFTMKTLMNPKMSGAAAAYRTALNAIDNIAVYPDNPKKLTVTVIPFNFKAEYITGGFPIIPEHIFDANGLLKGVDVNDLFNSEKAKQLADSEPKLQEFATILNTPKFSRETVVGSGPYTLKEWMTGEKVVLEKRADWWGDRYAEKESVLRAYPKTLDYRIVADEAPLKAMLQNQTLDAAYQIANSTYLELKADKHITDHYNLYTPNTLSIPYIGINGNNPKFKDKRVRQALSYLIDYDEIVKTAKQGMAEKATSIIPVNFPYYNKSLQARSLDIKKASQLLTDAGWTDTNNNGIVDKVINGKREEMTIEYLISAGSQVSEDIAVIFKNNAKKAGVNIDVQANDRTTNLKKIRSKTFELYPSSFGADLSYYDFYQYFHTKSGSNRFAFGTPETDKLIENIRNTTDDGQRFKWYQEMQEIIDEEQPVILLYRTQDCMAIHKRFDHLPPSLKSPGYFEEQFKLNR